MSKVTSRNILHVELQTLFYLQYKYTIMKAVKHLSRLANLQDDKAWLTFECVISFITLPFIWENKKTPPPPTVMQKDTDGNRDTNTKIKEAVINSFV